MEFGQIPKQLFNVPHPRRRQITIPLPIIEVKLENEEISPMSKVPDKIINKLELFLKFPGHKTDVSDIIISDNSDMIYTVGQDSFLKMFSIARQKQLRNTNVNKLLASCLTLPDKNTILMGCFDDDM